MGTFLVDDDAMLPSHDLSWNLFLSNRDNKAKLVLYLSHKMLTSNDLIPDNKKLYVSFEGDLYMVTSSTTTKCPFNNNHEEADTRMFWLATLMDGNILIRSTDTDILAIALLNSTELSLDNRSLVIQYGPNLYCHLNDLIKLMKESVEFSLLITREIAIEKIIGALHFVTGCDDLSYLRGFSKLFCYKSFVKNCDGICSESSIEANEFVKGRSFPILIVIFWRH